MSKKTIIICLVIMLCLGILSLYTTFAYDEENSTLGDSNADYNLIYSIKEKSNKIISLDANEEKFIDITLENVYSSTVKYGMYYYLITPKEQPSGLEIKMAENSKDLLQNTIKPGNLRNVSLKITNNSEEEIELMIGALVGFENGKIEDLPKSGEILIK